MSFDSVAKTQFGTADTQPVAGVGDRAVILMQTLAGSPDDEPRSRRKSASRW